MAGAVVLFLYGWAVNTPPWGPWPSSGRYVVLVFLMAQVLAIAVFGQWRDRRVWAGGALIIGGGVVIALSAR